jgi:hypothetical protein
MCLLPAICACTYLEQYVDPRPAAAEINPTSAPPFPGYLTYYTGDNHVGLLRRVAWASAGAYHQLYPASVKPRSRTLLLSVLSA